ncbi:uncharacterized protein [Cherax quadricarinatus]
MVPRHLLCFLITAADLAVSQPGSVAEDAGYSDSEGSTESSSESASTNHATRQDVNAKTANFNTSPAVASPPSSLPESSVVSTLLPPFTLISSTSRLTSSQGNSDTLSTAVIPTGAVTQAYTPDDRSSMLIRGDLPPFTESEERLEDISGLLFSPRADVIFTPNNEPPESTPKTTEESLRDVMPSQDLEVEITVPTSTVAMNDNTIDLTSMKEYNDVTVAISTITKFMATTITDFDLREESFTETVTENSKFVATDLFTDSVTSHTSLSRELQSSWVWFFIVLRGNCLLINMDNSNVLVSDFITSFTLLLLYNKDNIVVNSLTCSGDTMNVNMSVGSASSPNFEEDLKTLLSHKNLRIDLHNASFYIESYETKRTLIFETKSDLEKEHFGMLYLILGSVGVSLLCTVFAGIFFVIYKRYQLKRARFNVDASDKRLSQSPRSLHHKMEMDHTVRFSDTLTYSVNIYKSCSDLRSPDFYDQYGSIDSKTNSPKALTNAKVKEKKNLSNWGSNSFKGNHQDTWLGNASISGEEINTLTNVNTINSFKNDTTEQEEECLNPLFRENQYIPRLGKSTIREENIPVPSSCPPTPAITNDVLRRMDDLISKPFSSSIPNISTKPRANLDCTCSTIPSTPFTNKTAAATTATVNSDVSSPSYTTTTTSSNTASQRVAPRTATSAENLCLTRITFLDLRVWSRLAKALPYRPLVQPTGKQKPA